MKGFYMFINKKGQTPKIETQQPVVATTKSVLPKTGEIPKDSFERTQEKKKRRVYGCILSRPPKKQKRRLYYGTYTCY